MKAAILKAPKELSIEEVEDVRPRPGSIVAHVLLALTCGTDVKLYMRGHPYAKLPNIIGHEFVGVVKEIGKGVSEDIKGKTFVTMNTSPCGRCYYCTSGQENLCVELSKEIIGFTIPGAYAEFIEVPQRILSRYFFELPEDVDPVEAAFLEPLSTVVHGHEIIKPEMGDNVAIVGEGPIGLLHLQLALISGVGSVSIFGKHWEKLKIAEKLGADEVININEYDPVKITEKLTSGRGFDCVIEATGKVNGWELAYKITRKGGRVLFFGGLPRSTSVNLDAYKLHYGELRIMGSFHTTPRDVHRAFKLIRSKKLKLKDLITGEVKLENVKEALESVAKGKNLKIIVRP